MRGNDARAGMHRAVRQSCGRRQSGHGSDFRVARYIGYGAVNIINAFNPTHIVLGDIISQAGQPLLNEVKKVVRERTIPEVGHDTKITLSNLPTDATVSGAAAVAITNFLEHPSMFFDVA